MAKMTIKFPCGFEYVCEGWSVRIDMREWYHIQARGCPIHGKKCKKVSK